MNRFSGIIFSDAYAEFSNELIKNRTHSSIPFAARFRMVDFVLSSLVNANVSNVSVITKKNYASLEDHLAGGRYWDLDHRNSGLKILSPFFKTDNNSEAFMARGRLDALRSVQLHIKTIKEEYVVLCNPNLIANVDFERIFDFHIESGADITAVYSKIKSNSTINLELDIDNNSIVRNINYSNGKGDEIKNVSLNLYVMKRDLLLDIIRIADERDQYSFETYALINNTDKLKIMGYEHTEYARIIYTINDYYDASMEMLDIKNRNEVFNTKRPITTRVKDTVPVLYQYNANIENCLIADGCKIDGTVRNSIIFRNVTIETGSVVENSIIMQNTVIGRDCSLNNVISDKNVIISKGKELCGAAEYPYVIGKNTVI